MSFQHLLSFSIASFLFILVLIFFSHFLSHIFISYNYLDSSPYSLVFCLNPGTRLTTKLEICTTKYPITKRNSWTDCRMVSEPRKQSMAWMETDYSKHTHFRWKIKWRLELWTRYELWVRQPFSKIPLKRQPLLYKSVMRSS